MSNAGGVAAQVILVAQVFLIGLATLEVENGVLARFRERLDRLRQDALDLDICDFDPVRTHRLTRRAEVLGVELEPSRHWFHAFGLWPQLIFSLGSGTFLPIVLWQESARNNLPLVGNPLSDHRYSAGYAILIAELLLLVMLSLHIYSAKRSLRRMADAVIVAIGNSDDARYVVTPGLAGLDFSSIPQPRITPRYAPTGDVKRAAECAACVSQATRRLYGWRHPLAVSNDLGYAVRLAEAGRLREAMSLAESAAAQLDSFAAGTVDKATATARLATVHRRAGSVDAALGYARESYAELRCLLGRDHPATLDVFDELIRSLDAAGQYRETFRLLDEEGRSPHRPLALRQKSALARALLRVGQYAKGVETYKEVLAESRETLGDEHPETLRALNNLAAGHVYVGQPEDAERMHEEPRYGPACWGRSTQKPSRL